MEGIPDNPEGIESIHTTQESPDLSPQPFEDGSNQPGVKTAETNESQQPVNQDEGLNADGTTRVERQQIQDTIDEMFTSLEKLPANLQEAQLSQYRDMAQDLLLASIGQHIFKDKNPDPFTGEFGLALQMKVMDTEYRKHMTNDNMAEVLKNVLEKAFPRDRNQKMEQVLEMADKMGPQPHNEHLSQPAKTDSEPEVNPSTSQQPENSI